MMLVAVAWLVAAVTSSFPADAAMLSPNATASGATMASISPATSPGEQFYGLWLNAKPLAPSMVTQVGFWARSLMEFHPSARIYLFSLSAAAISDDVGAGLVTHVRLSSAHELLETTPAEAFNFNGASVSYPQQSDLFRLAILYRWGGELSRSSAATLVAPDFPAPSLAAPHLTCRVHRSLIILGSWIDVDDICVRPVTPEMNVIGVIEWPGKRRNVVRFNHHFPSLILAEFVSETHPLARSGGLNVENDPMINWQPRNLFLHAWLEAVLRAGTGRAIEWGQIIPTALLSGDISEGPTAWLTDGSVRLHGQHEMVSLSVNGSNIHPHPATPTPIPILLVDPHPHPPSLALTLTLRHPHPRQLVHPAYACNSVTKAVKCKRGAKGPMFPPHDLRGEGLPQYDTKLSEPEFWRVVEQTFRSQTYFAVKNSKVRATGSIIPLQRSHRVPPLTTISSTQGNRVNSGNGEGEQTMVCAV